MTPRKPKRRNSRGPRILGLMGYLDAMELQEAIKTARQLWGALLLYGQHGRGCETEGGIYTMNPSRCTCGLAKLLNRYPQTKAREE